MPIRLSGIAVLSAVAALAQESVLPANAIQVTLGNNSPVQYIALAPRDSRLSPHGGAIMVDLDALLTLRNTSSSRIHGISLRVVSQESTMGGKASVSIPRLNIGPGETFPVHVVQKLVRPAVMGSGPLVVISLDGVLFQDLTFFGPDTLHSRRDMVAWEMEAQRDRNYYKQILARNGRQGLQQAMLQEMARIQDRPQLDRPQLRRGPAVTSAATADPEHAKRFAFVQFPDSPVEAVNGMAVVNGPEMSGPQIEVRNRGAVPVKFVEIGWLVEDQSGEKYLAASVPSSQDDLGLGSGKTATVSQPTTLKISRNGQPLSIKGMTGYISEIEFANGKVWVPTRQNLDDATLRKVLPPSAEFLRLAELYRKGIDGLIAELNKP